MAWILAVDDEEGIRNLIQNALEKDGHRVSVCENTEVIKEKDLIHYDLILLDIMMPKMDGFEVLAFIKKKKLECQPCGYYDLCGQFSCEYKTGI